MGFLIKKKRSKEKLESSSDVDHLKSQKREMIQGVSELADTTVKEIMIPRIDTVFISVDNNRDELKKIIRENGFSRFPVFKDTIDNVIGILYVKDLLKAVFSDHELNISELVRKAYFIPESKRIDSLLSEFKKRRVHIAVSVDEYGGVSGIVSLEDIIEEIVGDIQDEFDNEGEEVLQITPDSYLCDARTNIEELNVATGFQLPQEDFDTLGGFVFDLLGKIPVKYEKISWHNLDFIIQEMDNHKILMVKIIRKRDKKSDEV